MKETCCKLSYEYWILTLDFSNEAFHSNFQALYLKKKINWEKLCEFHLIPLNAFTELFVIWDFNEGFNCVKPKERDEWEV